MCRLTLRLDEQVLLDELILFQYFHCVWRIVVFLFHEVDLAERAPTDHCQQQEVVNRDLGARLQDVLGDTSVLLVFMVVLLICLVPLQVLTVSGAWLLSRHRQVLLDRVASLAYLCAGIYKAPYKVKVMWNIIVEQKRCHSFECWVPYWHA